MSQKDKAEWKAILNADPSVRAAWDSFTDTIARAAALVNQGHPADVESVSSAAGKVLAAIGDGSTQH